MTNRSGRSVASEDYLSMYSRSQKLGHVVLRQLRRYLTLADQRRYRLQLYGDVTQRRHLTLLNRAA